MSVSYHVVGIVPADEQYRKMAAVWEACRAAHVDPPQAVADYFSGEAPSPEGATVCFDEPPYLALVRPWRHASYPAEGLEVTIADLPPQVKTLRFVISQ